MAIDYRTTQVTMDSGAQPVAVTLLDDHRLVPLTNAAQGHRPYLEGGALPISPFHYFFLLGLEGMQDSGNLAIIIVNRLSTPLKRYSSSDARHSSITHYPVTTDQTWIILNQYPNGVPLPNPTTQFLFPDLIPAAQPHPAKGGPTLYGVGAYRANSTSAVYANDGAMTFRCGETGPVIGIAWQLGFGSMACLVGDMSQPAYQYDEAKLYDAMDKLQKPQSSFIGKEIQANAGLARHADPAMKRTPIAVLTVVIGAVQA